MQKSIFFDTFTLTPLQVQLGEEKLHLYNFNMEKLTNPVIRYLCQASYLLQSLSCLTRSQEIIHDQHTIWWSKELRGHVEVSRGRLPCKERVVCRSESQIETEDPTNLLSCICMLYIWYLSLHFICDTCRCAFIYEGRILPVVQKLIWWYIKKSISQGKLAAHGLSTQNLLTLHGERNACTSTPSTALEKNKQ